MAPVSMVRRTFILRIATFARCRRALSTAVEQDAYKAIVVGAGPAGIATVGNLLDRGIKPVLWADERFNGGRLNRSYREVPSNTKVSLFVDFARAVEPFRRIVDGAKGQKTAYSALEELDQQKGCQIKYAADLCLQLTDGLRDSEDVRLSSGFVKHASQDQDGNWSVATAQRAAPGTAPLLILCTGSAPNAATLPSQYPNLTSLYLDVALNPPRLSSRLPTDQPLTIALIGASHSAILVLRNLYNLASSSHPDLRIKWFSRHSLRYAEDKGDWILRDNTGLKGETAIWAKENLEPEVWDKSPIRQYVEKVDTSGGKEKERAQYDVYLPDCAQVVEAVGFSRNAVPELVLAGEKVKGEVVCDHVTGALMEGGKRIRGLYGVGIAWPEKVVDPAGNTEYAVGLWKFMKYLKRIVPGWVGA